jgi:transcriptional regulator with XRE-family HTH domain
MTINPIMKIIRAKKLGVLIRDARMQSGKSLDECAQAMGIPTDEFTAMEFGERPPTLPELELFAYTLGIPLDHFWGRELVKRGEGDKSVDPVEITKIRQAAIGELIQKGRNTAGLSIDELAENAGITPVNLQAYEAGDLPIPLTELESLTKVLNESILSFEDQQGPVGSWFNEQKYTREFHQLPRDLQEFVSKPVNRPYIELAIRLSELKVEKLRALGEGLLEITL